MHSKLLLTGATVAILLGGVACTTMDPYSSAPRRNNTGTGVIAGALGGALLGYLTNTSNSEEGRKNALIGAGIGALGGAAVGSYMDRQQRELEAELSGSGVGVGNHAATEDEDIADVTVAEFLHDTREQGEMGTGQQRQADAVGILLQDGFGDLFGGLVQAGVDDLEAMVAQREGDGLRATIMAIEPGLRHDDAIRALHEE